MLAAILICVFAYVFGSIPTGYWIGKLLKGIDIRTVGSGSTGATNVLRSVGKIPAAFVLFFDMFKGALPVLIALSASQKLGAQLIPLPNWLTMTADPAYQSEPFASFVNLFVLPGVAGMLSLIGHAKSIFLGFQGGKSAATGLGTLCAMNPAAGFCMFVIFVSTTALGRIVSVASMLTAAVGPFLMYFLGQFNPAHTDAAVTSSIVYNIFGSSYVILRHKSNIQRLIKGTEPKIGQKVKVPPPDEKSEDAANKKGERSSDSENSNDSRSSAGGSSAIALCIAIMMASSLVFSNTAFAADTFTLKESAVLSKGASTTASGAKIRTGKIAAKNAKKDAAATAAQSSASSTEELPPHFEQAPPAAITPEESTNIKIYKADSKAVVNVTAANVTPEALLYGVAPNADTGSGSIISADGYILTNNHVINGASMVRVTLHDGSPFPAKIVGIDPDNDLAVLKIEPGTRKLSTIKFGDSSKLEVGRRVYAIGNPFGLDLTLTSGIISSVGRTMRTENGRVIKGVLQTDAAINPGNSGGPLLDTQGNMVGVTTAILSKVQQSAGIGFAIPINVVKRIVPQLIAHGAVLRPNLGIQRVRPTELGLMVIDIDPNGPAAQAGIHGPTIRRGRISGFDFVQVDNSTADVIVGIDKQRVATVDDLLSYVETKKPGQVVTLNVLRQGQVAQIPVKLAETKAQP